MTLLNDHNDIECSLISNKLLNSVQLKLPNIPVEFLQIEFDENLKDQSNKYEHNDLMYPFASSQIFESPIHSAKLLTSGEDVNSILEVEFQNEKYTDFEPGDTIGILPKNTNDEINFILNHLNLSNVADQIITISCTNSSKKLPNFIPTRTTIRNILTWCLDIRCIPKKLFLRMLSVHTQNPDEKTRLEQLCSVQGKDDYTKFILEKETNLIDIFKSFPSCKPKFDRLLEHLPRLMPRSYSICSSPLEKSKIKIVLSIVKHKNNLMGLCSGYIKDIAKPKLTIESNLENLTLNNENNSKINYYFKNPSNFHLPNNQNTPIIMIATGTGISPFVGFLQHRQKQMEMDSTLKFGEMWLFYGCRYSNKDFIYKSDLNIMLEAQILTKMYACFSRDKDQKQKYVQDYLRLYKNDVINLILHRNAVVYICGDKKKMAVDVKSEIINNIKDVGQMSENEANEFMEMLVKSHRYVEDIWQ